MALDQTNQGLGGFPVGDLSNVDPKELEKIIAFLVQQGLLPKEAMPSNATTLFGEKALGGAGGGFAPGAQVRLGPAPGAESMGAGIMPTTSTRPNLPTGIPVGGPGMTPMGPGAIQTKQNAPIGLIEALQGGPTMGAIGGKTVLPWEQGIQSARQNVTPMLESLGMSPTTQSTAFAQSLLADQPKGQFGAPFGSEAARGVTSQLVGPQYQYPEAKKRSFWSDLFGGGEEAAPIENPLWNPQFAQVQKLQDLIGQLWGKEWAPQPTQEASLGEQLYGTQTQPGLQAQAKAIPTALANSLGGTPTESTQPVTAMGVPTTPVPTTLTAGLTGVEKV